MPLRCQKTLDRLVAAYCGGGRLVLLFDYDGTLVPLADHPQRAQLGVALRQVLENLARQPRLTVGIVSGRGLDDLKRMVGLTGLVYGGTNGLEVEMQGVRVVHPGTELFRGLLEQLVDRLQSVAEMFPGAWVENKPFGFTVHYRAVAARHRAELLVRTEEILRPFTKRLRVLDGPMAVEVTPALGWTKGTAIRMIADSAAADALLLYAGDETNDIDAFEVATARDGIAIGIGSQAPLNVQLYLPDPAALLAFLMSFQDALVRLSPSRNS